MLISQGATAGLVTFKSSSADDDRCKSSSAVTLTDIQTTGAFGAPLSDSFTSTTCGNDWQNNNFFYTGNTHPKPDEANGNFGLRNDGFMNMDSVTLAALAAQPGNNLINGYGYADFIGESDLEALGTNYQLSKNGKKYEYPSSFDANDGVIDDPGWIKLGADPDFNGDQDDTKVKGSSLSDILEIAFTGAGSSGSWTLTVKQSAITLAEGILGRPAVFDHLAIVLKSANNVGIYDFNFNDIFGTPTPVPGGVDAANDGLLSGFNYSTPYTFTGNWSTADMGGQGLSHWEVYARDPVPGTFAVPAPASLWLAILGIAGLVFRAILRK
ncbi:hypothetical protein GCM10007391_20720 [Alteromonas halophila]|uniref:PEP-CTERM sorting domain-containing protein n=2 Tax=Alteromonas halophila TaxID=516698 RepID=A0A918JKX5_9ALTE|nr:hypothetical protein GCM10007391_20720 [Alteromonas halophila]